MKMKIYKAILPAALCAVSAACVQTGFDGARPNTLSDREKSEGYVLLFDGETLPTEHWVGVKGGLKSFPSNGWFVEDGSLGMRPTREITQDGKFVPLPAEVAALGGGGDIVTVGKYRDFVFKFEFRLTPKANSGVKYFFDERFDKGTCEEYQVLDPGHPDYYKGRDGNRKVGALYDLIPAPLAEKAVKPCGEWNSGKLVVKGDHVEHWLNGVKVLEYRRGSEDFRKAVDVSKYAKWGVGADGSARRWGENAEGRIMLQDHADSTVYFRNLKIRDLSAR